MPCISHCGPGLLRLPRQNWLQTGFEPVHEGFKRFGAEGPVRFLSAFHLCAFMRLLAGQSIRYRRTQGRKTRSRGWPAQHLPLQQAGRSAAHARGQPARHQRVFEHRKQGHGGKAAFHQPGNQPQQHGTGCIRQRHACAVIRQHAPAGEFRYHP